jgi:hypothetical protein
MTVRRRATVAGSGFGAFPGPLAARVFHRSDAHRSLRGCGRLRRSDALETVHRCRFECVDKFFGGTTSKIVTAKVRDFELQRDVSNHIPTFVRAVRVVPPTQLKVRWSGTKVDLRPRPQT